MGSRDLLRLFHGLLDHHLGNLQMKKTMDRRINELLKRGRMMSAEQRKAMMEAFLRGNLATVKSKTTDKLRAAQEQWRKTARKPSK